MFLAILLHSFHCFCKSRVLLVAPMRGAFSLADAHVFTTGYETLLTGNTFIFGGAATKADRATCAHFRAVSDLTEWNSTANIFFRCIAMAGRRECIPSKRDASTWRWML